MRPSALKAFLSSAAVVPALLFATALPAASEPTPRPTITVESTGEGAEARSSKAITIELRSSLSRPAKASATTTESRRSAAAASSAELAAKVTPSSTVTTASARLAVNADLTTAPSASDKSTTSLFSPEQYRTATSDQLKTEIQRLRQSVELLPKGSRERRDLEDLIESHEIRLQTGIPVQELVAEITAEVSQIRGLAVKEPVRFRLLEAEELKRFLDYHLEKDYPGEMLESYEFVLKQLGAVPERTDLRRTIVGLLSEQIAGLYDPETKLLYVMRQFDLSRTLARIILAHEICHALQDQHYNILSMPITQRSNNDVQMASQSVLEGDATLLMQDYASEMLTPQKLTELLDVFFIDQRALNKAPYFLQRQLVFPYMGGADFLQSIILAKGDKAREEALREPPSSTEQILHPEKFTSRDLDTPTTVTLPDLTSKLGKGWRLAFQNVFGEFQTKTLFETWREWEVAPRAADGWDGDQYALYRNDGEFLLLWASVWDSESDAKDFYELFSELMRTKVYKEWFGEEKFVEDTEVRLLPKDPGTPAAKAPVRLRFRIKDQQVLVAISNSPKVLRRIESLENSLFVD